jgi:hypothetical protein
MVMARARATETDGGTVEASLADRAAAAFYQAGMARPRGAD